MMADSPVSVFISYSRTDSAFVDRLEADLRGYGFNTWVDRQHLEGGADWARLIEQQISKCDVLVVALSPDAVASQWVQNEIVYAQSAGKHIIPVLARPVERVPIEIIRLQFIDLGSEYANRLQELRVALLKMSSLPTVSHPTQAPQSLLSLPDVSDPLKGLVQIPPAPPAPNPDLMAILRQAQSALAHGELDLAEALLQQVVAQEKGFGNGLAAEELKQVREQLAPIQLQRLRTVADQAHIQGAWGQEIGALSALTDRLPEDIELRDRLSLAEDCQTWSFLYDTAREFAQEGDTGATSRTLAQLWAKAPYFGDPAHIAPHGMQATSGSESIKEQRIRTIRQGGLLAKFTTNTSYLRWSPNGQVLATGAYQEHSDIHLWDTNTWKRTSTIPHFGVVSDLMWSADGSMLAYVNVGAVLRVSDGSRVIELPRDDTRIHHWSQDGRHIVTFDKDGALSTSDTKLKSYVRDMSFLYYIRQDFGYRVPWLVSSLDGKYIAAFAYDSANLAHPMRLYSIEQITVDASNLARHTRTYGNSDNTGFWPQLKVIFHPPVASHRFSGRLYSQVRTAVPNVTCASWAPASDRIVIGSASNLSVIFDVSSKQHEVQLVSANQGKQLYAIGWSPDGSHIASASEDGIQIWDVNDGRLLFTYSEHKAAAVSLAWSPDGTRIASGDSSGVVHIWKV